jgi:hypothetical protein
MIQRLNSRRVGAVGVITAIGLPLGGLFHLLTDPSFLYDLWIAVSTHSDPDHVVFRLVAAVVAIIAAAVMAYLGAPYFISGASASGTPPAAPPAIPHNAVASPAKPEETDHA